MFPSSDSNNEIVHTLNKLIENWENEVVEFKEANNDFDKDKIGRYFSAMSNEANLKGIQYGWLVFGVRNKDKKIAGTNYRDTKGLDSLKQEIAINTTGGISFIEIYELNLLVNDEEKRVIMFQIPAAATGIPTGWKDHFYGRNGESLGALSIEEQDRIRGQEKKDWSKQIIPEALIEHLNKEAIAVAREKYKEKMNRPHISEEVDKMTDEEFLIKTKLIQNGKITNAAMLLLGNEDFDYLFTTPPEASWRLYDSRDGVKDYEIFKIPYITLSDRIFSKIRNLTYRYMPNKMTLFPSETKQYDVWLLRELMNNCIAHSDYTLGGRIYLNEVEDQVILTNPGTFLPGDIEVALQKNYNPPFYRNQLLAETMVKFNMIDTQSMGIRKVFRIQQEKYFPLPDYDFKQINQVGVTVYGKVIDENYSRVLFDNPDFDIETAFLIDRVQKHKPISKDAAKYLRKLGVIEGKMPNIFVSSKVAESLDEKEQYVKNKGFDEEAYQQWIISYLKTYKTAKKQDIMKLLSDKLPDSLDDKQKENKVKNIMKKMRTNEIIELDSGNKRLGNWVLKK
ncbi:putative DNA binding domain-containing protein [Aerococcaceae bacterium zg-ZJ1578]|uniref:RNA-binding domain-containing protein n=1 Tax=Aerococcaceae bacterium zg-252 TaxID=2796928 RepID=UPI001A28FEA2|nr:putative DNA binding domain-containing protein [Aerococcaceae bacterium zg-1578]